MNLHRRIKAMEENREVDMAWFADYKEDIAARLGMVESQLDEIRESISLQIKNKRHVFFSTKQVYMSALDHNFGRLRELFERDTQMLEKNASKPSIMGKEAKIFTRLNDIFDKSWAQISRFLENATSPVTDLKLTKLTPFEYKGKSGKDFEWPSAE